MDDPHEVPTPARAPELLASIRRELAELASSGACGDRVPHIVSQLEQLEELIEREAQGGAGWPPWVWQAIVQIAAALIEAMRGTCSYQQPHPVRSSTYDDPWVYNQAA